MTGFQLFGPGAVTLGAATAAALYFHRLFGPVGALLGSLDDIQRATAGLSRPVGITGLGSRIRHEEKVRGVRPPPPGHRREGRLVRVRRHAPRPARGHAPRSRGRRPRAGRRQRLGQEHPGRLVAGTGVPDHGRITVGGSEAPGAPARYLVTQEVHLFGGTLADNLRIARPDATDEQLRHALREVGAGWALDLECGPDTVLGPGGVPLDDGSVQHLALVRVLLADPPVVLLDEATAESGPRTRALLQGALAKVTAGRTAVVVAHRLEQARQADQVVVLRDGEVAEAGTHDELPAAGGEYAALWAAYHRAGPGGARVSP